MNLNSGNYYGSEANRAYMSKSQFSNWQRCEAATLAELNGEWKPEPSVALLVGGYIDAALDSPEELERFKEEHPEILNSRTGELKADFKQAEQIVARCKSDRLFALLTGNAPETSEHVLRQVIFVGRIGGVSFRGKADFVLDETACKIIMAEFPGTSEALGGPFTEGAIVDLKSAKDFASVWSESEGRRVNWISAWDYEMQGAIYRELCCQMTGKKLPFVIVAATKEKVTDLDALYIPSADLDAALEFVEEQAPLYENVKQGGAEPLRCGRCDYCKSTRTLTKIRNYKELDLC